MHTLRLPTLWAQTTSTTAHNNKSNLRSSSVSWRWASNARNMSRLWTLIKCKWKWRVYQVGCVYYVIISLWLHGQQNIKKKSVSITTTIRTWRPRNVCPFHSISTNFSVFLSVHTNTGVKPASFSICIGGFMPRVEVAGTWSRQLTFI
jgi:hypothetical protein